MYDKGKVTVGIAIFAFIFSVPFWYNAVVGKTEIEPELVLTEKAEAAGKCIEDTAWMRENHMLLLDEWRDLVVREGYRLYTASDGEVYNMSLSNTCMDCHSNYMEFCNRCHSFEKVDPVCWDCHLNWSEGF